MSERKQRRDDKLWGVVGLSRREFLRRFGIAGSALTFSPFFVTRMEAALAAIDTVKVYKVMNGDSFQNTAKIWELLGGPGNYIDPTDIVIIKGNAQWSNQGYTHTGCIKGVIDKILEIPGFSGEVHICDNVQEYGSDGAIGFDVPVNRRNRNWPDHNWNSLATEYQGAGHPVATKRWRNSAATITGPADGEGWMRDYFNYFTRDTYLSHPIYESPLTAGRMIDTQNGVWESGGYTGRNVKAIFMPTLNNHGASVESYAGITSAIKCFFGASEIHYSEDGGAAGWFSGHSNMHKSSFRGSLRYPGAITARFINNHYAPVLYITAAMWSGHLTRTSAPATETKTVLACENPATLDYVSCRDVIGPLTSWLNPDLDNNTRDQILGCINGGGIEGQSNPGVGTITPGEYEVIVYDFDNPTATRLDIDIWIKKHKAGLATEQEVKDVIDSYING